MLGRWAICEACFCTRCEKEKKGYSSCEFKTQEMCDKAVD